VRVTAAGVTKVLQRVAVMSRDASPLTLARLQALGSELEDLRAEGVRRIAPPPVVDVERVEQDTRDTALRDLVKVAETELSPSCAVAVRNLVRDHFGLEADPRTRGANLTTPRATASKQPLA
jgi:hypothetical protein